MFTGGTQHAFGEIKLSPANVPLFAFSIQKNVSKGAIF